jgi:class 3 adenylate cyclase/tetratricopeptide (TPR) repeat protein
MRCSRCRADNSAGMKFCGQCGAPLGSACPSCGAANPSDNRFCGQCGAALDRLGLQEFGAPKPYLPRPHDTEARNAKDTLPGEMKQVTVLFCDIVNSTAMTERLGAEAMRDLVSSFLKESLAEVHRYGGTAPQFTGDGFMALFGAPVAFEDHVRRCLLAALAIQRALGADASKGGRLDLPVRFGIHTGPVVFGPLGERLPMDFTAIGDTANVAARLQQAAEPGTILLSEATRRLAQGFARLEPIGPLTLKGKDEPIVAYRLLGVSHRRSGLRESGSGNLTTFVDRYSELAILNSFLRQVENGRSQTIGVVGEPGIGKSRLLAEFRQQLARGRVTWVEGRCVSYGTAIPYWLLLDLLRNNCGIVETDTQEAITEKVRSGLREVGMDPQQDSLVLLHLLGISDIGGSPALSNPEAVKTKAFEIFHQLSIKASAQRPLVLLLEDLHWIDKISEEFLGFLAENAPDARILMLATYRPGYHPPWIDKSYGGQAPLQPLSRDDSLQMVRSVLSAERLVDLVTQEIVAKADGNPFFLEQLALHAGEAKDLRSDLMVPDTIHDVVMARIDRLPEQTKRVLQTAAVIGREFSPRLLNAVWKGSGLLETQLRELMRLEFISERVATEGNTYIFRHALTQEAAYGSLLERHRRAYHGTIGHALEELYRGRIDEITELLALHFGRSDEPEKAVDYAILAGERAQRRWANSQALSYFTDALRLLDAAPDTKSNRLRRIDAVISQGELKLALGRHAEHLGVLEQIRGIIDEADDPHRRAAWHYWAGFLQILTGGHATVAIGHCREAAEIASSAGFHELDGFIASCLAQAYIVAGELRAAIETGERALSIFEAGRNLWWASRALWHLSSASNCLGEWEASLSYCRRALEYGTVLNDLRLKVAGLWRTGCAYVQQGDTDRGVRYCEEALALTPIPFDAAAARMVHGYGLIKAGRVETGISELGEVVAWFESSRLAHLRLLATLWLAEGHLTRGDPASATPLVEEVLSATQAAGYVHFEGVAHRLISECLVGEASVEADEHLKAAIRILDRAGARNDFAKALVTKAKLCQTAGDDRISRQLLEEAYAIFRNLGTRDEPVRVKAALAKLEHGA